jgi:hypothetical protein
MALAVVEVEALDARFQPGLADELNVVPIGRIEAYVAVGVGACL